MLKNLAISDKHGVGPIVVKMLADQAVNAVLASEFGPSASALLKQNYIIMIKVKSSTVVSEAINNVSCPQINIHIEQYAAQANLSSEVNIGYIYTKN